uniref:DNA replication ATP-dependent helicase/nuclease n=2 Tax=Mesocestoides corti TaxID=53468 RepID=A0A5K3F1A4_MESCO
MQHLWAENDLVPLSDLTSDPAQARVSGSQLMLAGSIIHEVFQTAVRQRVSGCRKPLDAVLSQSLFTPSKILQLYAMDATAVDFCESLEQFLPLVDRWVAENCIFGKSPTGKPTLKEVLDVEENIWCTKIGVKGKIDMTVVSRAAPEDKPCLIPLELKTGKPSFSVEHVGQVLLYLLMLSDRHADRCRDKFDVSKFGWLVYLHEGAKSERGLVKPQAASFRGLIQSRNQLAASLRTLLSLDRLADESGDWSPPLPRPVDSERVCSRCPYTLTCGVFRDDRLRPPPNAEVRELFDKRVGHISADHRRFLRRWTRLQLLEHASSDRVDNVLAQIASESAASAAETSTSGIRDLVIHGSSKPDSQNGFLTALKSRDGGSIKVRGMSNGDFLIVSSDDGRHIGLCLAFLTGLDDEASLESGTAFDVLTIRTDRPLPSWVESFRLDRCISDKTVQINLSNLVGLMADSPLCSRLRRLLVDCESPRFTNSLTKPMLLQIRRYLRPLNVHQRKAILSVLMSKDYTLIEGFPGSGKTETLAALLRCLCLLQKRTLLISHTHSAVDNVLLRLTKDSEVRFVRLGAPDKVNPLLRPYNLESRLSETISSVSGAGSVASECSRVVAFLETTMSEALVVGSTALAAGGATSHRHPALARLRFDVVVVDEATQLSLPTVIGGLLCLDENSGQFVLIGDPNQLPPLVRSNAARSGGFATSLFSLLTPIVERNEATQLPEESVSLGSCRVQLRSQYRMNSRILHLANNLFYDGQMECASDGVATATLHLPPTTSESKAWLNPVLSSELGDSVVFLDTQAACNPDKAVSRGNVNVQEVDLVVEIVARLTQLTIISDECCV